jgi:hypothetical protein
MRGHKFNAVRTTVDGYQFSSKAEARRYAELRLLEKAGEIESLELQPVFPLRVLLTTGTFRGAGKAIAGDYPTIGKAVMDFKYFKLTAPTGWVTEDVKGWVGDTPLSRWKRKHVEAQYGITVVVVKSR